MDDVRFAFGKSHVSLLNILTARWPPASCSSLALWISAVLERQVLRQAVHDLSLRKVAANAIRATLLLVGVLFALSTAGVDLTALSVLGGALGVGSASACRSWRPTTSAASSSCSSAACASATRCGSTASRAGGRHQDPLHADPLADGRESIVPNEKLITERIENLSLADPKVLLSTDVAVGYDSDVDLVQKLLCEAALARRKRVLADPAPGAAHQVRRRRPGVHAAVLDRRSRQRPGQREVGRQPGDAAGLRAAGIDIPFPQRVVHVRQLQQDGASSLL
jgi:small-conductance mechanosensitive channel